MGHREEHGDRVTRGPSRAMTADGEADRVATFLASNPRYGNTTVTKATLRALLLKTDAQLMSHGSLWDIVAKPVGAGIYRVTLRVRP